MRAVRRLALVLVTLGLACIAQVGRADAALMTLTPTDDTWVSSDRPSGIHGSDPSLQIGGYQSSTASDRRSYIRFAGTVPAGAIVTRTTLRLYFQSAPSGGFQLRLTNPQDWRWLESTLTFNTAAPSITGPVSGETGTIAPGWNSFSVPFLPSAGAINYVLTRASSTPAVVQSGEAANPPKLMVEYSVPSTTATSVCSKGGCIESRPWITTSSWALVVADFDGDGLKDHFVGRHGADEQIYRQQPAGSFAAGVQFPHADRHGCASADVNRDRRLDIYCMRGADGGEGLGQKTNELWIAQPNGTYTDQAATWGVDDPNGRGRRALFLDFFRDGRPDLYITNWAPDAPGTPNGARANRLFVNLGNRFEERVVSATGDYGSSCVAKGDWDHDNNRDFVVCGTQLNLFHNSGNGLNSVTEQRNYLLGAPIPFPTDAKLSDLNRDGWDDLIVITKTKLQIRFNAACPVCNRFDRVTFAAPLVDGRSVSVGDLTGDGNADVYVVEGIDTPVGAVQPRNTPDQLFAGPTWTPVPIPQTTIGTGDDSEFINVTGRPTLIVTNGLFFARGPVQFIRFNPTL